jgi:hypothetical protein
MGRPALGRLLCTEYTQYIHLHILIRVVMLHEAACPIAMI